MKLIGDEVMFAAFDAVVACDIALALVDAFTDHDRLPRCGARWRRATWSPERATTRARS